MIYRAIVGAEHIAHPELHQENMETLTKAYIALKFNNNYQNDIPSDKVRLR